MMKVSFSGLTNFIHDLRYHLKPGYRKALNIMAQVEPRDEAEKQLRYISTTLLKKGGSLPEAAQQFVRLYEIEPSSLHAYSMPLIEYVNRPSGPKRNQGWLTMVDYQFIDSYVNKQTSKRPTSREDLTTLFIRARKEADFDKARWSKPNQTEEGTYFDLIQGRNEFLSKYCSIPEK